MQGYHPHYQVLPRTSHVLQHIVWEWLFRQKVVLIIKCLFWAWTSGICCPGLCLQWLLRLKISSGMKLSLLKGQFLEKACLSGLGGAYIGWWLLEKFTVFFFPFPCLQPQFSHSLPSAHLWLDESVRDVQHIFFLLSLCCTLAIYNRDQCCDLREIAYIIIESLQS